MFYIRRISGILSVASTATAATAAMVVMCLAGCAPVVAASAKNQLPVSVHGVNYTGNEFTYVVVDPNNPSNTAGGELVGPFSAGGTMCCFDLPRKWAPGINVQVKTTNMLVSKTDQSFSEVRNTYVVEVPQYVDGKAGELWVIRTATGDVEVVSSDYQPDHANWPGKIKGWPVPSVEYRRARWEIYVHAERESVQAYKRLLSRLEKSPEESVRLAWEQDIQYFPDEIKQFTGPSDPRYANYLQKRYQASLAMAIEKLRQVEAQKP